MFSKSLKSFFAFLILSTAASSAFAVSYDIKEMTPQVQQALEARKSRFAELQQLKASGAIGEDNRGYVKALSGEASSVAAAENADRRAIYSAIVSQHNLGPAGLEQVEQGFADVQRERSRSGDSIQLPSGEWVKK